jgi:ribonuclease HI
MKDVTIFTDGGSRGNPGMAACAFVVEHNDRVIGKGTKFLDTTTNNIAEYSGVIIALEWVKKNYSKLGIRDINFILDSELVVRQLNKQYKVKNNDLKILHNNILQTISELPLGFVFESVTRDKNKLADKLVNETLDNNS